MPEDWTIERFLTFALGLGPFESLGPDTIEELSAGLVWMMQRQAELGARLEAMDAERRVNDDALWVRMEEIEVLLEQQRQTIEALVEENDMLRAQLYAQDRKAPNAERRS
jgi:hypothetical protein